MALVVKDRVRETSTTTGTGTITLAGAVTGYQSFSAIGNANTTYYTIYLQGGNEWEVGIGTYTSSGTTLSRDTILASSNGGSAVNFSAGTKDVFVTYPAGRSVYYDTATNVTLNQLSATTVDTTNLEVTNIKAKDGTAAMSIADSTGVVSITANPVLSGGTANGVLYLNASKVATSGSALTFDGTTLTSRSLRIADGNNGTQFFGPTSDYGFAGGVDNGGIRYNTASGTDHQFRVSGSDRLRITSGGQVNIGGNFTSTNNTLQVTGNAAIGYTTAAPTTGLIVAGNVGIGTDSPAVRIHGVVAGTAAARIENTASTGAAYWEAKNTATSCFFGVDSLGGYIETVGAYNTVFYTNSKERARIDSSGTLILRQSSNAANTSVSFNTTVQNALTLDSSGNLGIGTSSPGAKLDVNGQIRAYYTGGFQVDNAGSMLGKMYYNGGLVIDRAASTSLLFQQNGSLQMTLDSSGNLGLGVTPSAWSNVTALQIQSGSLSAGSVDTYLSSNAFYSTASPSGWKYITSSNATQFYQNASGGEFVWRTAASGTAGNAISFTQAMTLDASGNLLVGTTTTSGANMTVYGSSEGRTIYQNATTGTGAGHGLYVGISGTVGLVYNYANDALVFGTNNTERARITSIGGFETRPAANGHAVFNEDSVDADFRVESDANTHMLFVDAGDNSVNINTSSPLGGKLNVTGAIYGDENHKVHYPLPYFYFGAGGINDEYLVVARRYVGSLIAASGLSGTITGSRGSSSTGNILSRQDVNLLSAYNVNSIVGLNSLGNDANFVAVDIISISGVEYYALRARPSGGECHNGLYFDGMMINNTGDTNVFTRVRSSTAGVSVVTTNVGLVNSWFTGDTYLEASRAGYSRVLINSTETVVNDSGLDYDFRVESDTNTHALFVDASENKVAIGSSTVYTRLTVSNGNSARTGITLSDANTASMMLFAGNSSNGVIAVDSSVGIDFQTGANVGQENGTVRARIGGVGGPALTTFGSAVLSNSTNIDPDDYANSVLAGNVADGSGFGGLGIGFKQGAAGQTGAIVVSNGGMYFGIGDNASANSIVGMLDINRSAIVFNENSLDTDFRVESDTDTHCLFVDASTDRVGIGTATPGAKLEVQAASPSIYLRATTTTGTTIGDKNNRLVLLSDSSTANNGGEIVFAATDTNVDRWAAISGAIQNNGVDGCTGDILFATKGTTTATTLTERARITLGGALLVNRQALQSGITDACRLQVLGTSGDWVSAFENSNSTTPYGLIVSYSGASPNGTGSEFLYCADSTAARAEIRSNGGLANYQSNNVDLSDIRTKTDISPLASYWNKIAALEIVTYKYKDQTHDDLNIGVIAQQVEQVAPEFVDPDGFGETPEDGVPLKTIYNKDLTFAAIKALQEAMARIEKLEAEVAALKGA